jgi:hypothetical protein
MHSVWQQQSQHCSLSGYILGPGGEPWWGNEGLRCRTGATAAALGSRDVGKGNGRGSSAAEGAQHMVMGGPDHPHPSAGTQTTSLPCYQADTR